MRRGITGNEGRWLVGEEVIVEKGREKGKSPAWHCHYHWHNSRCFLPRGRVAGKERVSGSDPTESQSHAGSDGEDRDDLLLYHSLHTGHDTASRVYANGR